MGRQKKNVQPNGMEDSPLKELFTWNYVVAQVCCCWKSHSTTQLNNVHMFILFDLVYEKFHKNAILFFF